MNPEIIKRLQEAGYSDEVVRSLCTLLFYIDNGWCNLETISEDDLKIFRMLRLVEKNYKTGDIKLRERLYTCSDDPANISLMSWIEDFRNLTLFNGKPFKPGARSNAKDIERNVIKFKREYPKFSLDQLYEAYKRYIEENIHKGAMYIPEAAYFIWKNNKSMAATMIEEYASTPKDSHNDFGVVL